MIVWVYLHITLSLTLTLAITLTLIEFGNAVPRYAEQSAIWGGLCPPGPNVEPPLLKWWSLMMVCYVEFRMCVQMMLTTSEEVYCTAATV